MTNEVGVVTAKKRPLLPRWLKFLLMLVGTFFFLAAGAWVLLDITTRQDVERLLAEMEGEGWPTTYEGLCPEAIPAEENASFIYQKAYLAFSGFQVMEDDPVRWGLRRVQDWGALDETTRTDVRELVKRNRRALELVHEAAQTSKCQFEVECVHGIPLYSPQLGEARELAFLAHYAAIVSIADGRLQDSFDTWSDLVAMARHHEGQGLSSAETYRLQNVQRVIVLLEALIQSGQLSNVQIEEAFEALAGVEARDSFFTALKVDVLLNTILFQPKEDYAGFQLELRNDVLFRLYNSRLGRPWRQYELGVYLALSKKQVERAQRSSQLAAPTDVWFEHLLLPAQTPLTSLHTFLGPEPLEHFVTTEARVALARTALALELYRLIQGGYPDALTDLTPHLLSDVPLDPFDGQPLRYINEGKRVVVYSVGEDLQDDRGFEDPAIPREGDIVFTVRRAPAPTEK